MAALGDIVHRVAHAGILRQAAVGIVRAAGFRVDDNILHQRAEADSAVDLRLALLCQIDALSIAAALKVEHGLIRPAVLVITDELAVGVGRKRGLAGAGETEENSGIPILADVGGAMHGEHTLFRHQIVHHGEHGLLDLGRHTGCRQ